MANKFRLELSGFDEWIDRLEKMNAEVDKIIDIGFDKAQAQINAELHAAMKRHRRTGVTEASIVEKEATRHLGGIIERDVGFKLSGGVGGVNLRSVYLMYGTPRVRKDTKLYNAIYGARMRKVIHEIMEDNFLDFIIKYGGE